MSWPGRRPQAESFREKRPQLNLGACMQGLLGLLRLREYRVEGLFWWVSALEPFGVKESGLGCFMLLTRLPGLSPQTRPFVIMTAVQSDGLLDLFGRDNRSRPWGQRM